MMSSFLLRLLLAIVLVVNGTGSALASAGGLAAMAPAGVGTASGGSALSPSLPATEPPPRHLDHAQEHVGMASTTTAVHRPPGPDARMSLPSCHEAAADPVADVASDDDAPAHGHCCHDACSCVCSLQAHAATTLPAPVPERSRSGMPPRSGWDAPDPALLLRPPIA